MNQPLLCSRVTKIRFLGRNMDLLHTLDLMISPLTLCWHGYSLLSFPSYMTRCSYKEHSPRLSKLFDHCTEFLFVIRSALG